MFRRAEFVFKENMVPIYTYRYLLYAFYYYLFFSSICIFSVLLHKFSFILSLAGLPGFARDSCSIIMSICAFHFYIIYFNFFSADHGIPQTFD